MWSYIAVMGRQTVLSEIVGKIIYGAFSCEHELVLGLLVTEPSSAYQWHVFASIRPCFGKTGWNCIGKHDGYLPCGHPSFFRIIQMGMASLQFIKAAPI